MDLTQGLIILAATLGIIVLLVLALGDQTRVFFTSPAPTRVLNTVPLPTKTLFLAEMPTRLPFLPLPTFTPTSLPTPLPTASTGGVTPPLPTIIPPDATKAPTSSPTGSSTPTVTARTATVPRATVASTDGARTAAPAARTTTVAQRTSPPSPAKYSAPLLLAPADNLASHRVQEVLVWQPVTVTLAADEIYVVDFWKEGAEPTAIAWTQETTFVMDVRANPFFGDGIYLWRIQVAQVTGNLTKAYLSEPSETRRLTWIH